MADISFDGIQIDAEKVRAKLEEHDKERSINGRSLLTQHYAELHVVKHNQFGETVRLSFTKNSGGHWEWNIHSLREAAEFLTTLADDLEAS